MQFLTNFTAEAVSFLKTKLFDDDSSPVKQVTAHDKDIEVVDQDTMLAYKAALATIKRNNS